MPIPGFPSLADHVLILLFGWLLPFLSGIKGRKGITDIVFTEAVRKRFYLGNSLFLGGATLILCLAWVGQGRSFGAMGFRAPSTADGGLLLTLIILLLGLWLADLLNGLRTTQAREDAATDAPFLPRRVRELPGYLLLCLSAAVCEETIYRGFMVTYFLPVTQGLDGVPVTAVVVPALLFSLAHLYQGWKAVLKIWGLSLLLGLIFITSDSLWIVMAIHFVIDLVGGLAAMWVGERKD